NSTIYSTAQNSINWTDLEDGIYYYNVTVNDTLGNGSYITEVLHLANFSVQIDNVSWNNLTPVNTNITVQVRTNNLQNETNNTLIRYLGFDGESGTGSTLNDYMDVDPIVGYTGGQNITTTFCKFEQCWQDDGTDSNEQSIEWTDTDDGTDLDFENFTIMAWVNTHTTVLVQSIIMKSNSKPWELEIRGAGFRCRLNANNAQRDIALDGSVQANTLYHVACRYNGTDVEVFVDGVGTGSPASASAMTETNQSVTVGWFKDLGGSKGGYFNGTIDEVMIFNRPLTDSQIKDIFEGTIGNWTSYTFKNISNPYKPPANSVNGTFAQLNFSFETITTKRPSLINYSVGYSNISAVVAPPADTCTCDTSGNWYIDCSDNCVVSSECNMDGSDLHATGSGTLTITSTINNVNNVFINTNSCNLFCYNPAGCFG
ncbi:hypothetical protein LCGC14_2010720, partial [marine sediment metagenome]